MLQKREVAKSVLVLLLLESVNAVCKILEAVIQMHTTHMCDIYYEIILTLQICEKKIGKDLLRYP